MLPWLLFPALAVDPPRVDFGLEVRPILAQRCFVCHGPDESGRKGELALHNAESAAGVIVPGDPSLSEVIRRITSDDPDERMPAEGPALPTAEIEVLRRWIAEGAHYGKHWSWEPVRSVEPPAGEGDPIDRFLGSRLESAGIAPSPRADRATLARRVALDLTGLPPTDEQRDAFLAAADEEAGWATLVDGLLESPRHAEHFARHWLDLVRYAETHGHEFDFPIPYAWRYRDSMIRAFQENTPWDTMVVENIAGDLIQSPRLDDAGLDQSMLATGFWWFTQEKHGPTDPRAEESDRVANQIDVMSKAFLGITAACARCHDHKFDAITAEDYASLSGVLRSSRRAVAFLDPGGEIQSIANQLDEVNQKESALLGGAAVVPTGPTRPESLQIIFDCDPAEPPWFADGFAFDRPTPAGEWRGFGTGSIPARAECSMVDSGRRSNRLRGAVRSPSFTIQDEFTYVRVRGTGTVRQIIDGYWLNEHNAVLFDGQLQKVDSPAWSLLRFRNIRTQGHRAWIEVIDEGDGAMQVDFVAHAPQGDLAEQATAALETPVQDVPIAAGIQECASERARLESLLPEPTRALVMVEGTPEDEVIFLRGDHRKPGAVASRGQLSSLGGAPVSHGSGRLQVAREIVHPSNPLAARVAVNRLWTWVFGRGLVPTPDDLGGMGVPPTHPELLDSLAASFVESGWDTRAFIRRLVMSEAYRRSTVPADSRAVQIDPANELWHSMRLRRLESESIRDSILAVSGRLDESRYGPPVATHLSSDMTGRGKPGTSGPLDGGGRRTIYLEVRRNFLDPFQHAFDQPVPATTAGQRRESSMPSQALALLNDEFVHAEAKRFAARAQSAWADPDAQRRGMVLACFGRDPTDEEAAILEELSIPDIAHVLFNSKAFLYKN